MPDSRIVPSSDVISLRFGSILRGGHCILTTASTLYGGIRPRKEGSA